MRAHARSTLSTIPSRTLPEEGVSTSVDAEAVRLREDAQRVKNWKRWGPYLSERQWGTVREDYSPDGSCWSSFSHDHARSRAYRWGEDGLLGITDREARLCFALALWNGRDEILKERLFGLTGPEGNHGEDVKEIYAYEDSTPTHSYLRSSYRYPHAAFPYRRLVEENAIRSREDAEFEIADSGVFEGNRFFEVRAEYAKADQDDICIRINIQNHGDERALLHVLPTLWFRNTWSWGCTHEGCFVKPRLEMAGSNLIAAKHSTLGSFTLALDSDPGSPEARWLFTENETNAHRLFGVENKSPYVKDAFHEVVIHGRSDAANPKMIGTKAAAWIQVELEPSQSIEIRLRLFESSAGKARLFGRSFDEIFKKRKIEADSFFATKIPSDLSDDQKQVARQAYAGLLHSKQFYHYVVRDWLTGDPDQPAPPTSRLGGRNADWKHLFNRDVISMPDKWEYPWFAAWDLAFHMIPMARVDADFAKDQLLLLLREWYMHPNGQLPAYEFALGDVNPPVHAWACWRVYKISGRKGGRDRRFLERAFHKLLINFSWWVNRKDFLGQHLFSGGFLGLDNIGVFDRSKPIPGGGHLEQADGTAWMAFFCTTMLSIALELAEEDPAYEDVASKFFEHFVAITEAINSLGGSGLWNEEEGFFYDQVHVNGSHQPLRVRSMVGLVPLFVAEVLELDGLRRLPGFMKRMRWFLENRGDIAHHVQVSGQDLNSSSRMLLSIASKERLRRILPVVFDEAEFLSPYGIRSLSKRHHEAPFVLSIDEEEARVSYSPGESESGLFGGNSNWRGPIWFPVNYLLIEALERLHHFHGPEFRIEYPTRSGKMGTLSEIARDLKSRLSSIFTKNSDGRRPFQDDSNPLCSGTLWCDLLQFHEYFHGDTGRGVGASHQTGWTALVATLLEDLGRS